MEEGKRKRIMKTVKKNLKCQRQPLNAEGALLIRLSQWANRVPRRYYRKVVGRDKWTVYSPKNEQGSSVWLEHFSSEELMQLTPWGLP